MTTSLPDVNLRVVAIGAGPVGLAAAAHLLTRGETPLVLEAGDARRRIDPPVGPCALLLNVEVHRRFGVSFLARAHRLDSA